MARAARLAALVSAITFVVVVGMLFAILGRECPTEDSSMCTWYVTSGNAQGSSFTDFGFGVVYWSH